jgi:hypothetical protein
MFIKNSRKIFFCILLVSPGTRLHVFSSSHEKRKNNNKNNSNEQTNVLYTKDVDKLYASITKSFLEFI